MPAPTGTSPDDAELQRTLDAAESHVTKRCGPLGPTETTVTAALSGDQLVLPATRLATVAAVRDPDGQLVTLDTGATNLLSGIVRVPYRRPGFWSVDITSAQDMAGDARLADLRLATLIIAAHLWETQRVPGRAARPGFGQPADQPALRGFAIPEPCGHPDRALPAAGRGLMLDTAAPAVRLVGQVAVDAMSGDLADVVCWTASTTSRSTPPARSRSAAPGTRSSSPSPATRPSASARTGRRRPPDPGDVLGGMHRLLR
jgi:hypothetical protein